MSVPAGFGFNDQKARNLYAQAKSSDELERTKRALASGGTETGFLNPQATVEMFAIRPGMVVADLGAGEGRYTIPLAQKVGDSGTVYAVEVQKDMLGRIKKDAQALGLDNIIYLWADVERARGTKINDNTVDFVLVANVLFQSQEKLNFLLEANRILKNGGKMVIIDWIDSFSGFGPPSEMVFSPEKAQKIAESAGFVFEQEFPRAAHHYILMFRKP